MKKWIIIIIFLLNVGLVNAQSLLSSVVGSAGDQFASASGSLEWTLGEIMTETYQQSNGYFTQGFQQPATIKITSLDEEEDKNVVVYPNPTRDILNVKTLESGDYLIEMFDMQGQKLLNLSPTVNAGMHIHQINLQGFRVAVYLLRISNTTTGKTTQHKIEIL